MIIHKNKSLTYNYIFNNLIFGIDIDKDNVRRCKILLNIFVLLNGESNALLQPNIKCSNSLQINWNEFFGVKSFNFIIGNPPYVNTHDMNKTTIKFLKDNFSTTQSGVFNIFYAFVEQAMKFLDENGKLGYIVPNNFLTIKSATNLRTFLSTNYYLTRIIDFSDNMIFSPVRTYNCIIQLSKKVNKKFEYCIIKKTKIYLKNSLMQNSNTWILIN